MNLCVIGAGAAGLCAAKNGIDFGCQVTVYEKTDEIGGTWVYTDDIGKDKNGLDVHSSMYQGLYTNLPKEIMGYPWIPFPEQGHSYVSSQAVLKYYQVYAERFNILNRIKFEHHVLRVRPLTSHDRWEVIVQDMKTLKYETQIFDAVLVCNGHYTAPSVPEFKGHVEFAGRQMHSHDFRSGEKFRGESVLVVGTGPSGTDITFAIAKAARNVTLSYHQDKPPVTNYGENVNLKPNVKEISKRGVTFDDNSYQDYDVIIYCTGYKYSFPFLSVDCGIGVAGNCVEPIFKHCLNINRPTMGFIGLPNFICPNQMFDLQTRFCLTFITGRKASPPKQEMIEDLRRETAKREARGVFKNKAHYMGPGVQDVYYEELAMTAEIEPIRPVIPKIFGKSLHNLLNDVNFRNRVFKVIDDENFVEVGDDS